MGSLKLKSKHRVLCGDSTSADDVARLMDGEMAHLMVTDPPYGVSLDQGWRDRIEGVNRMGTAQSDTIHQDDGFAWAAALDQSAASIWYVWTAPGPYSSTVCGLIEERGVIVRQQIIWSKTVAAMSRSAYHWKHEPCWYGVRKGATGRWIGGRKQTTIWEAASPKHIMSGSVEEKFDHPTQKPVEVMARPIRNHDAPLVYDPFLGSGTTLIAAEQLGRKCYGLEISPAYCDVIVNRWQKLTGEQAVNEKTGDLFPVAEA